MTEPTIIHCRKHALDFNALDGCPECLAEKEAARQATATDQASPTPTLVKVKYSIKKNAGTEKEYVAFEGRAYTYFTAEPLEVGDVVEVPVQNHTMKGQVVEINVPESEIEAFRDKVKTIPAGSKVQDEPEPSEVTRDTRTPEEKAEDTESTTVEFKPGEDPPSLFDTADAGPYGVQEESADESWKNIESLGPLTDSRTEEEKLADAGEEGHGPADNSISVALAPLDHINPTAFSKAVALYQEIEGLLRVAQARVIQNDGDVRAAADDLGLIAKVKKAVNAERTKVLKPYQDQVDVVRDAFKLLLEPLEEADQLTRGQVKTYRDEAEKRAAEARRIEEEKYRLAQEEAALNNGEHTQNLGTLEEAATKEPPALVHSSQGTVGGRVTWKAEVVDFALLPDTYKLPNQSLLDSYARTTKGKGEPIPGVRIYSDKGVTVRSR